MTAVWPHDSARARRTDRATSHEAADATAPKVAQSQAAVRHALTYATVNGRPAIIDPDIAVIARQLGYHYSDSRLRTARRELEDMGVVVEAGSTVPKGHRRMTLWKLKETA